MFSSFSRLFSLVIGDRSGSVITCTFYFVSRLHHSGELGNLKFIRWIAESENKKNYSEMENRKITEFGFSTPTN